MIWLCRYSFPDADFDISIRSRSLSLSTVDMDLFFRPRHPASFSHMSFLNCNVQINNTQFNSIIASGLRSYLHTSEVDIMCLYSMCIITIFKLKSPVFNFLLLCWVFIMCILSVKYLVMYDINYISRKRGKLTDSPRVSWMRKLRRQPNGCRCREQ